MNHADLLALLLPPSSLDQTGALLGAELTAEGTALDAALGRSAAVIEEGDPRTAVELFLDWEHVAGLPDTCPNASGAVLTMPERRAALLARLIVQGGQTPAFFIALAAVLGYTVTITEFRHLHDVNDDVNYPLIGAPWQFTWQVNTALNTVGELTVNDSVADPLAWWGNAPLECVINRLKPAHTHVLFSYM